MPSTGPSLQQQLDLELYTRLVYLYGCNLCEVFTSALHFKQGHLKEAMKVLEPYLPKPGQDASPYTAGGSLYALGIIHANHGVGLGQSVSQYLLTQVRENAANEVIVHGACLGLGLASMASCNQGMAFIFFRT